MCPPGPFPGGCESSETEAAGEAGKVEVGAPEEVGASRFGACGVEVGPAGPAGAAGGGAVCGESEMPAKSNENAVFAKSVANCGRCTWISRARVPSA